MNQVIEFIVFAVFVVLFFAIVFDDVRLRFMNYKLGKEIEQNSLNYLILSNKLEELVRDRDRQNIEGTDGFLKFLTESRDWAFQYIEDVQRTILKLQKIASKINLPPNSYVLTEELNELKEAIAEILRQLPEESRND